MYKRRIESSSSSDDNSENDSSQSLECRGGTANNNNSRPGHLSTGNESCKKARNDTAEQREQGPVASTSSQFQAGDGVIVKEEIEENDDVVEHTEADLAEGMDVACSSSMAGRQSQPEVERSRGGRLLSKTQRISKDPPSKKISAPTPHEKYFEGSIVMGGSPFWPGIIRKPGADDKHPDYSRTLGGKISFFVQFFTNPTTMGWRKPSELRVFDVAKPNRCKYLDPIVVAKFENAIRIATAATDFSVKARLEKFTSPNEAGIDNLLCQIDFNTNHAANEVLLPKRHEKLFEGSLVMASTGCKGYKFWPGMIRKAGAEDLKRHDYSFYEGGKMWFCVQYFKEPTPVMWVTPGDLRVFDAAKTNVRYHRNPAVVVKFETAVRIARAAANYSVETRLEKFTLLKGAAINGLLAEIDNVNSDHITTAESRTRQDSTPVENSNSTPTTTQRNGGSSTDSFETMMEERMSEHQKLREEWNREKEEEIRSLTRDKARLTEENNKLTLNLNQQAIFIVDLQQKQEKEKLELKKEVEKEKQEKLKYKQESEKRKALLEKAFPALKNRKADISSDSEDGEEILRQMEINLRIYTPRHALVAATTPADESKMEEDDKGDQNKSTSLPKKNESAAPDIVGVGRGRGRARNPPATSTKGLSTAPETATSTKKPSATPEIAPWLRGSSLIEKLMLAWAAFKGEFPPYDPSDYEVEEKSESAGETDVIETAVALGKGLGRGLGRGKEKRSPLTATSSQSQSARESSPQPGPAKQSFGHWVPEPGAEASDTSQARTSQPEESQHVPVRHPFYDRGYEIEEPVWRASEGVNFRRHLLNMIAVLMDR
ncbi:hypothetical protein Ocin01_15502 [Orchesella cincta]|uniref:PWWP domain-containing protein n=1 Tax=Orchesella cincta TaxID=48709 RepID=A0A1D2MDW6_ORCCI|nr:hypothetical protein Ocin01_15502 [Orchesella cincta]